MDILKDTISVNKQVIKKTFNSLVKNWMIIFTGIAYVIINMLVFSIIFRLFTGALSIIAGIIAAVVSAGMISNYLYLLYNVINYDRISFQDFKDGFTFFLRKVYGVFFFAWIGSMLISTIGGIFGPNRGPLNLIINLSILILLNALPETIYLKSLSPMESIMYSFDFIKDNWYNWLIPNAILYFSIYLITGSAITNLFTTSIPIAMLFGGTNVVKYLLAQLIFSFTMIYRGHLFKLLSTSNRRKRMFMSKF